MGEFAAFLGISALVIATPGQDTALVIRNTLRGGRGAGAFTALGVATGQAVWTLAVSAGVAALLLASEPVFVGVKLVGAAYLVLLGAQAVRDALRGGSKDWRNLDGRSRRVAPPVALRQGVVSSLGNPKLAVFFTGLLPQFAPEGDASFVTLLLLGLVFCSLTLGWLVGYAVAVARAGDLLRRPSFRRTIDAITGTVLVAFGLRLATAHR